MVSTVHKSGLPSPSGKTVQPHKGSHPIRALRGLLPANGRKPASWTVSNRSTYESRLACSPCHNCRTQIARNFPVLRQMLSSQSQYRPDQDSPGRGPSSLSTPRPRVPAHRRIKISIPDSRFGPDFVQCFLVDATFPPYNRGIASLEFSRSLV